MLGPIPMVTLVFGVMIRDSNVPDSLLDITHVSMPVAASSIQGEPCPLMSVSGTPLRLLRGQSLVTGR